jgi:VanZ family protein
VLSIVRVAAWTLAIVIVVLSVVPAGLRPETDLPHVLEHFTIFFAMGLTFGLGYDLKLGMLTLLLIMFDGGVEIAQLFVAGRHARLSDFIVDAAATWIGVISASLVSRILAHFNC